jgi:hypothetical protein
MGICTYINDVIVANPVKNKCGTIGIMRAKCAQNLDHAHYQKKGFFFVTTHKIYGPKQGSILILESMPAIYSCACAKVKCAHADHMTTVFCPTPMLQY